MVAPHRIGISNNRVEGRHRPCRLLLPRTASAPPSNRRNLSNSCNSNRSSSSNRDSSCSISSGCYSNSNRAYNSGNHNNPLRSPLWAGWCSLEGYPSRGDCSSNNNNSSNRIRNQIPLQGWWCFPALLRNRGLPHLLSPLTSTEALPSSLPSSLPPPPTNSECLLRPLPPPLRSR